MKKTVSWLLAIWVVALVVKMSYQWWNEYNHSAEIPPRNGNQPEFSKPTSFRPEDVGVSMDKANGRIMLEGDITPSMAAAFNEILKDPAFNKGEENTFIILNSKGGDLYAAMEIGRAIRNHRGNVVAVPDESQCFSACVFILAAGDVRVRRGQVGIHRPYAMSPSTRTGEAEGMYEKISRDARSYLREMRVREALFDDMVNVPPNKMHVFQSESEMDSYGLLELDPVAEEVGTAKMMKRFGITDRQVYMQRWNAAQFECAKSGKYVDADEIAKCFNYVMSHGY